MHIFIAKRERKRKKASHSNAGEKKGQAEKSSKQ